MAIDFGKFRNPDLKATMDAAFAHSARLYDLGTPLLADDDKIVTSTNMKVGTYTVAAQPDVPRNITVKRTAVGAADTGGTIVVAGTNYNDAVISETFTVGADGVTVTGAKAFKTVTSVTGAGWVIGEGNDTIIVGIGALLGMYHVLKTTADIPLGIVNTTIIPAPTVAAAGTIEGSTVDLSSGTFNGSKKAYAFVVE
jgi:hypothetical protein